MSYQAAIFDLSGTLIDLDGQVYPGAIELLSTLRDHGIKLACVTAGGHDDKSLRALGLGDFFHPIVRVWLKKTPTTFKKVIKELGVEASQTLGIGDSLHSEIRAMNEAGITTVWVAHDQLPGRVSDDEKPHFTVNNLAEIEKIVWPS